MNIWNVFRKEVLEQWRTHKLLIVSAVLVLFGLTSPLLAKFMPEFLSAMPGIPAGLSDIIPAPTVNDALTQYIKNMSQFGILLALLMSMGSVAQEKERGTAAMILTRPVSRGTFLWAKFAALRFTFFVGITLAALGCWYYTWLLFEPLPVMAFIWMNILMLVNFMVYVSMTIFCSTLLRSQTGAAGLAFGGLILLAILGAFPKVAKFLPGRLFDWGLGLVLNIGNSAWSALWVSLGLIAIFMLTAWLVLRRQEI
ncbi:MAG: ABC transporter permease [Anaerolineales bacterium]